MCLDLEIQSVCTKFFENLKNNYNEEHEVYSTVLYFIHAAPNLSKLYLNWSSLDLLEKFTLNIQINRSLGNCRDVYPSIIKAFDYWETLQNNYGAPGYSSNPLKNELKVETDQAIVKLLHAMEKTIDQIYLKRKLLQEMTTHKNPHDILHNYKWRIVCKNINKRRSNFTKRSKPSKNEETYYDAENSDLSGCGDTSWFTNIT